MSDTYLQDFGHLRKQVRAREVHDPMSSAGRWEDLELNMKTPHIPTARRKPVRRNMVLTIDGVSAPCKHISGKSSVVLGFHTKAVYVHKLVTPKAHTYRRAMEEAGKPEQTKLYMEPPVPYHMRARKIRPINDVIRSLVRKIRFGKTQAESVKNIYRRKLARVWKARHDL